MRGQVILTDLAISIMIGVAMIVLVQAKFTMTKSSPAEEAFLISEQLVANSGTPDVWDDYNVILPGLAIRRGEIDPKKIYKLERLSPEKLRETFSSRYLITVTLDDVSIGNSSIGENNFQMTRYVTMEGEPHKLGVILSKD